MNGTQNQIQNATYQLNENEKLYYLNLYKKVFNILPIYHIKIIRLRLLRKYLFRYKITKKQTLKVLRIWKELGLLNLNISD